MTNEEYQVTIDNIRALIKDACLAAEIRTDLAISEGSYSLTRLGSECRVHIRVEMIEDNIRSNLLC